MIDFKIPLDGSVNTQIDLLADILSWQVTIANYLMSVEAHEKECNRNEILKAWNEKKDKAREEIIEQILGKYGSNPSKDLGL